MSANIGGCGCSGSDQKAASIGTATAEIGKDRAPKIRPGLVNQKVTLLMAAGAAMAGNCEPCLRKIVPQLKEIGATGQEIRSAIHTGQMVKDRPAAIMKQVADELTGTQLFENSDLESCPGDTMEKDNDFKIMMLIAAASAMAANCEFCLNKVIPDLIEAGVSESDMRKAVEVGQFIKDKPAAIMKEAADTLTGSSLSEQSSASSCECSSAVATLKSGCCG